MTWNECLALGATKLAAILNCPVTTAHSWIRRSGPADWLQPILAAYVTKKHNKPAHTIPPRRPVKRKDS